MSGSALTPPGDRYRTSKPCSPQCCGAASSSPSASSEDAWIAVKPYSFVFRAPVKGRWLGRGLLDLFLHEFAFVPCSPNVEDESVEEGSQASKDTNGATNDDTRCSEVNERTKEEQISTERTHPAVSVGATACMKSAVISLLHQQQQERGSASSHFSTSPDPANRAEVKSSQLHCNDNVSGGATLDRRITLPAYVEELCDGALWLHGREAECRAVGRRYRDALIDLVRTRRGALSLKMTDARHDDEGGCADAMTEVMTSSSALRADLGSTTGEATEVNKSVSADSAEDSSSGVKSDGDSAWAAWHDTVQWLMQLPSQSDVDAFLPQLHALAGRPERTTTTSSAPTVLTESSPATSALQQPLVLRQRDIVQHRVWRREGRMLAEPPLRILRCDVARAVARFHEAAATGGTPHPSTTSSDSLALVVVSKPAGLPVHPSGCYRKNSVTRLLEDVFGGCEGEGLRYTAEEHFTQDGEAGAATTASLVGDEFRPYASILHRREGFELMRVYVQLPAATSSGSSGGVSLEDWRLLKALLHRCPATKSAEGERKDVAEPSHHAVISASTAPPAKRLRDGAEVSESSPSDGGNTLGNNNTELAACGAESATATSTHEDSLSLPPDFMLKAFVVHRLDAATSGVLFFGLDSATARRTAVAMANKTANTDNKDSNNGGRNKTEEVEEEEDHDDDDGAEFVTSTGVDATTSSALPPSLLSSSQKVYYARVHGRVDLHALARTQHHCALRHITAAHDGKSVRCSTENKPPPHATPDGDGDECDELIVQRPIGCVDHHHSLYWCPDAALTETWREHKRASVLMHVEGTLADKNKEAAAHEGARGAQRVDLTLSPTSSDQIPSCQQTGKGKGQRTAAALAAKRERMRRLTRGCGEGSHLSLEEIARVTSSNAIQKKDSTKSECSDAHVPPSLQRVQQFAQTLRTATTLLRVDAYDAARDETVVRCTLGTGRTHQLRVHLASLGHPIVCDDKYIAMERFLRHIAPVAGDVDTSTPLQPRRAADTPLSLFYAATEALVKQRRRRADSTNATPNSTCQRERDEEEEKKSALGEKGGSPVAAAVPAAAAVPPVPEGSARADPLWKTAMFAESRTARGCVCPEAICLHAWRYTLHYADSGEVVQVQVPLPSWAFVKSKA